MIWIALVAGDASGLVVGLFINPLMARLRFGLLPARNPIGLWRAALGADISLMPGTLAAGTHEDSLLVQVLTSKDSKMNAEISRLETELAGMLAALTLAIIAGLYPAPQIGARVRSDALVAGPAMFITCSVAAALLWGRFLVFPQAPPRPESCWSLACGGRSFVPV